MAAPVAAIPTAGIPFATGANETRDADDTKDGLSSLASTTSGSPTAESPALYLPPANPTSITPLSLRSGISSSSISPSSSPSFSHVDIPDDLDAHEHTDEAKEKPLFFSPTEAYGPLVSSVVDIMLSQSTLPKRATGTATAVAMTTPTAARRSRYSWQRSSQQMPQQLQQNQQNQQNQHNQHQQQQHQHQHRQDQRWHSRLTEGDAAATAFTAHSDACIKCIECANDGASSGYGAERAESLALPFPQAPHVPSTPTRLFENQDLLAQSCSTGGDRSARLGGDDSRTANGGGLAATGGGGIGVQGGARWSQPEFHPHAADPDPDCNNLISSTTHPTTPFVTAARGLPPQTSQHSLNNNTASAISFTATGNKIHSNTTSIGTTSLTSAAAAAAAPAADGKKSHRSKSSSTSSLISQLQEQINLHLRAQKDKLQQKQKRQIKNRLSVDVGGTGDGAEPIRSPQPIIRTTSDSQTLAIQHPVPDLNTRSGAYLGNIAQLEATAERLSMTSSIEDAIRDLHGELKRSDSRRSSILAASLNNHPTAPGDEGTPSSTASAAVPHLPRLLTNTTSIVDLNNAARHGGYSPSGYVMSPSHSLTTGRLRSASKTSNSGRPDFDFESSMSRHGPGKGSGRSVQSSKLSLAEIAESEPVALTQDVLDEADRTILAEEDDDTIRPPRTQESGFANTTESYNTAFDDEMFMDQHQPPPPLRVANGLDIPHDQSRPATRDSHYERAQSAFGDFDGVHCEPDHLPEPNYPDPYDPEPQLPDVYLGAGESPPPEHLEHSEQPNNARRMSHHLLPSLPRPKSYIDPSTGQQMMYYPARVPMMLNLPPKLSKKPKAAARNERHSRVLEAMGHDVRNSTLWADSRPDDHHGSPVEQKRKSQFLPPLDFPSESRLDSGPSPEIRADTREENLVESQGAPLLPEPAEAPRQRSPRRVDPDKRKSRMSVADLPPQLRASAFFDLPSVSPALEVKNGSAMATLDGILDASANAPVSAFTDHVFAGKLGSEVYGAEKKRKSANAAKMLEVPGGESKPRSSFLLGKRHPGSGSSDGGRRNTISGLSPTSSLGPSSDDARRPGSAYEDRESFLQHHDLRDERSDDEGEEEEEEGSDGEMYQGAPTTLLAELQLRKQQQKMRTRPLNQAYPNGMHATLLELDAVAEAQRVNRKGKRINLAWEDPAVNPVQSDDDDEEVPLGLLYAAKKAAGNDISAVVAEANRPLGLMERRDLEDNEPLSHRRARLQGQEPKSMHLAERRSVMMLNGPLMSGARLGSAEPSPQRDIHPESDNEAEGESLGDRMRRLKAKDDPEQHLLPRARPVSGAFSAELLSQFGDLGENENEPTKAKEKQNREEEETLGQRRRRLQAERGGGSGDASAPQLVRRLSMADILGAHPVKESNLLDGGRGRREVELRAAQDQDQKLRALRSQMPNSISVPSTNRSGAYRGGVFNDGSGGPGGYVTAPLQQPLMSPNQGIPNSMGPGGWNRASMAFTGYGSIHPNMPGAGYGGGMQGVQGVNGYNPYAANSAVVNGFGTPMHNLGMPMQASMQMQMQMPMNPGQLERVERWRQSVMP
jgi:hypothetical protein